MITAADVLAARHTEFTTRRAMLLTAGAPALAPQLTWPAFWAHTNRILRSCGYRKSTRRQYRQVLRALRKAGASRPAEVRCGHVRGVLDGLVAAGASWSWIALHITAVRTIFDRLCGMALTRGLVTPKRPCRIPETLSQGEAERLVRAGQSIRDQLLLGLLYGCGLAGSEAVQLRWGDVLDKAERLRVAASTRYVERTVAVPPALHELLRIGTQACAPGEFIFRGRADGAHISLRMLERMVRDARRRAGIQRPICVSNLRHSYAAHRLESGVGLRQVQMELGHASIRTTERYRRCLAPRIDNHPHTRVRALMRMQGAMGLTEPAEPDVPPRRPVSGGMPLSGLESVDLVGLRLPFAPDPELNPLRAFGLLLKDRLLGGFLRRLPRRSP